MTPDGQRRQVRGRRSTCFTSETSSQDAGLLSVPDHLLKRILSETASGSTLRYVCKAFSRAIAESALSIRLPHHVLRSTQRLRSAMLTYRNAGIIILDVSQAQEESCADLITQAENQTAVRLSGGELVASTLDALAAVHHPLNALVVRGLSQPLRLPSPTALSYLASCGLTEMELHDDSIQRASDEGATNLLRQPPVPQSSFTPDGIFGRTVLVNGSSDSWGGESIRARGAAMVRLALAVPSLRRLSLCNAAFSSGDVAALGALSQLEELSLVGAMECAPVRGVAVNTYDSDNSGGEPGGSCRPAADALQPRLLPRQNMPPQSATIGALAAVSSARPAAVAEATYQALLGGLPLLRKVSLPLAISGQHGCSFWHDGDDSSDDDDGGGGAGEEEKKEEVEEGRLLSVKGPSWHWPSIFGVRAIGSSSSSSGGSANGHRCLAPDSSTPTIAYGVPPGHVLAMGTALGVHPTLGTAGLYDQPIDCGLRPPPVPVTNIHDFFGTTAKAPTLAAPAPFAAPVSKATATVLCDQPQHAGGFGPSSALGPQWRLPPLLEDLTIPLCALNGPIFHAACDVYGSDAGSGDRGCRLRALHIPCGPGYTVWEGSFLNSECSFRSLSRLTSLETLRLSLELGASGRRALRRDSLKACLRHLRALNRLKDVRISETHQPVCFTTRKVNGDAPPLLSYTLDPYDTTLAPPCSGVRLPVLRPWENALELPAPPARSCLFAPLAAAPPPPRPPSAAALTSLLSHWPQLQRLVAGGQGVVRTRLGGRDRLIMVGSPEQQLGALGEGEALGWLQQSQQQTRHSACRYQRPEKNEPLTLRRACPELEQRCPL